MIGNSGSIPRRHRIAAVLALLVLAAVSACGSSQHNSGAGSNTSGTLQPVQLNVGTATTSFGWVPFYIAQDKGYFKAEKLTINSQVIQASTNATAALVSGSIDIGLLAPLTAIQARVKGEPVVTVATLTKGTQNILVMSKAYADSKGITASSSTSAKLDALKGAKIATNGPTAGATVVLKAFLAEHKIPETDVQLVFVTDTDALVESLKSGLADAFLFVPPQATTALTNGSGILAFNLGADPITKNVANTGVVVDTSWAAGNRGVLVRFMRAIWEADQYIQSHSAEAAKLVQPLFPGINNSTYQQAWRGAYATFPATPEFTQANLTAVVNVLINPTLATPIHPTYAQVANDSYVKAAKP